MSEQEQLLNDEQIEQIRLLITDAVIKPAQKMRDEYAAELARLRGENSDLRAGANQACEEVHDLATECLERTKTTEALHDEYERLYNAVIAFMNAPGSLTLDEEGLYADMVNCVYQSRFWSVQP